MRFVLGFVAGVATVWAALAIWQRIPEFPDLDAVPTADLIDVDNPPPRPDQSLTAERDDVHLRHKFPPPPVSDPSVHTRVGAP